MMDASIIIPSYNNLNTIGNCLASIFSQTSKHKCEVIVVNSSDKDNYLPIEKKFKRAKFIKYNNRIYPGTARNIGAKEAQGKILIFTDSDCLVGENWIDQMIRANRDTDFVIGGSIQNGNFKNLIATAEYLMEFGEFLPEKKRGVVEFIPSCNFSIKREIFEKIGGFPDTITSEDVIFSYVLTRQGYKFFFEPLISITHFNRTNLWIFLIKQMELGIGFSLSRKKCKLKGHLLTKFRLLAILIPLIRMYTVWRKVLSIEIEYFLYLIITSPIIFLGLVAYAVGFWRGFEK